ncbi:MAG TPA: hypothetical protein VMT16_06780 [Thermoanaerobaculia bacterium]|nr:hypothetical protein [Thermoanaerobaculia bacterium]
MRVSPAIALGALVAAGAACAPPTSTAAADWRLDPLWDDGHAEFCVYEVDWARYGGHYPGRALLVLVKEPWAADLDVKADRPRDDGFEVLKLNHVRDVPTGIYTYHQMASVYLRRDDASLVKVAATSSEACGVTTAYVRDGRLEVRSYFDGVGDRRYEYPSGALPQDGLPALLRDWLQGEAPAALSVMPSFLDSRLADLAPRTLRLRRSGPHALVVPAGSFEVVELRLEDDAGWLSFDFAAAPPHHLVRFRDDAGTAYRLAKCDRLRYWEMHDPGGESWLPPGLR